MNNNLASVDREQSTTTLSENDFEKEVRGDRVKYLIFSLDDRRYGLSLSSVKEVIGLIEFTPIPDTPRFFKGLINLRGKIHSIIDLRTKMGLKEQEYQSKKTSIIITEIHDLVLGIIVDDVDEVAGFNSDQIQRDLDISAASSKEYILGVTKCKDEKIVLILDIAKVFSDRELSLLRQRRAA